jgi:hypothetical protein
MGTSMPIRLEALNLVEIGQKRWAVYIKMYFIVDSDSTSAGHTEHIVSFPLRQRLLERASMLRYTYFAYLV